MGARPVIGDFDLIIGFDTEYVRGSHLDDEIPDDENAVLSYQIAIYSPATGDRNSGVFLTAGLGRRHRLSMAGLLERALAAAVSHGMVNLGIKVRIALAAHFTRADLPGFRDFNRLKYKFDAVRKTYCSSTRPAGFDLRAPGGRRVKASVTLFDTKLLAPSGAGSLRNLGALLGYEKLSVPNVHDGSGKLQPGIERMDLVLAQYPDAYYEYAKRDAEIAVEWLLRVVELLRFWELSNPFHTIGSMAVAKFLQQANGLPDFDLLSFFGKRRVGRKIELLDELRDVRGLAADCFHGGRNECFVHGIFREFAYDWDLKGAYTTALAMFRQFGWEHIERTTDLDRLAVLDEAAAFARVRFEFPANTRFPALPVDAGDYGLVYPLSGESYATGPELVVALNAGAKIEIIDGVRIPWLDPAGTRPFLEFAQFINQERAKRQKGSALELLVKEAGNSLYGKVAQAVASDKTPSRHKRVFSTREGRMKNLTPSRLTQPVVAALTTGLLRAVLSEILIRLPPDVRVYSATTDGWLSTASDVEAQHAASGPAGTYFASLRALVDPGNSGPIIEKKHSAKGVLSCKTRGAFSIEVGDLMPKPIVARAGHRLEGHFDDPVAEATAWLDIFRKRSFDTVLLHKQFISVGEQWFANADLVELRRKSRMNLDYDLKRSPINVHDYEGLIRFDSEPWTNLDAFLECRSLFDRWRESSQSCLKTAEDWYRFLSWKIAPRSGAASSRTQFENAVVAGFAHRRPGFPVRGRGRFGNGMSRPALARWFSSVGVPGVTAKTFENTYEREPDPRGTVSILTPGDYRLVGELRNLLSEEAIKSLLTPEAAMQLQAVLSQVHTNGVIPSPSAELPESAGPDETAIAVS
jgi:hypothetical protein